MKNFPSLTHYRLSPLDLPEPRTADEFTQLFKLLDVPTAFLSERFQSVSHSFGGSLRSGALHNTWFHFLSRHPNIDEYNRLRVVDPAGTLNSKPPALWDRFGCYLKIDLDAHSSTLDATTSNRGLVESPVSISGPNSSACISSSKSQAGTTLRSPPSNWKRCVTFVCFGSTQDIRDRLQNLLKKGNVHDILHDPYVLIDILIDELYQLVTVHMKLLRNEFRDIENSIIQATPTPKYALDHANFPVLHNMAKDAIYLEQSLKSLHKIASSATRFHQKHLISCQCDIVMSVQNSLEYRLTVIESSQVQIDTLQKRTHNLIHLTFNLVSQRDSQVMQMESYSMHVIAGIGLLLVPIASLSAFVQTPFFKVEEVDKVRIRISSWSFLALSVSSTLAVVIGWWIFRQYWMQKRSMGRRRPQPPGDA